MKKALGCLLLAVILSGSSLALSWGEAVKIAEENNNQLRSARKEVESTEWNYKKAYSLFLPQLSASASMTQTLSGTQSADDRNYSYGLSATQYLFRGMEEYYGVQLAYANVESKKASLNATRASVYYDLRSAFIDLLYDQENIKLLEQILGQRKENTRLIQLRYQSGKEDRGNLLATQAEQARAEYDLSSARRELRLSKLKLSQLLSSTVDGVEEEIEIQSPAEADFDELLGGTPSYVIAEKQLESAELSYKSTISGFLPSVSLRGSVSRRGNDWPPEEESSSWSLNLSYPFFPGGSNIAERAAKSAELDGAREDFTRQAKDLRYSLEQSFEDYKDSIESLELSSISLSASRERAQIIQAKYLNGLSIYDEWYRAENDYISAQKNVLASKKQALLSEAAWHKSYGGYVK